jgi:D-lactate dehydrogenase
VIVTSHQGFLTEEALLAISHTTLKNARDYFEGNVDKQNQV